MTSKAAAVHVQRSRATQSAINAGGGVAAPYEPSGVDFGNGANYQGHMSSFDGSPESAATVFTINVWIKSSQLGTRSLIFGNSLYVNESGAVSLRQNGGADEPFHAIRFDYRLGNNTGISVRSTTLVVAGQWMHLYGVFKQGESRGIRVNGGAEEGAVTWTAGQTFDFTAEEDHWLIGAAGGFVSRWRGAMCELYLDDAEHPYSDFIDGNGNPVDITSKPGIVNTSGKTAAEYNAGTHNRGSGGAFDNVLSGTCADIAGPYTAP